MNVLCVLFDEKFTNFIENARDFNHERMSME